jgi:hypothetical protein
LGAGFSEPPLWADAILRWSLKASTFVYIVDFGRLWRPLWIA